jgi:hypothetical protein
MKADSFSSMRLGAIHSFGIGFLARALLFLLSGTALVAEPSVIVPTSAADSLTEALPILRASYIDFTALHYQPGDHLSDLIARSDGKISLIDPDTASAPMPIFTTTLPGGILYWRVAAFAPASTLADLAKQLQDEAGESTPGIIIDLRSNATPDDYEGAAQMRALFAPPTTVGNTQGANAKPDPEAFTSLEVVLIDHQTTGAAEALASFLQANGALVVGHASAGKVAVFQEHKLASGQVLRFAVAADGLADPTVAFASRSTALAWGKPVIPDLPVAVDEQMEKAALALIQDNHIADVIQESAERHRMSEAALVRGDDPEWDDYLATLEKQPHAHFLLSLPPVHDAVLVSAMDDIKAILVSQHVAPSGSQAAAPMPVSTSVQ